MNPNRLFKTLLLAFLTGQVFAQRETKLNGTDLVGTWELATEIVRCPPEDTAAKPPIKPATLKFYANGQMECSEPHDMFFGGMVKWRVEEKGASISMIKSSSEGTGFWPKTNAHGDMVFDLTKFTDSCGYVPSVYSYRKLGGIDYVRPVAKTGPGAPFVPNPDDPVFEQTEVDTMAIFGRGESSVLRYNSMSINYPKAAAEHNIQGRVEVEFIVEKDGSLTNFKIKKDIGGGCGEEALRVLRAMPKWRVAMKGGEPVRVRVGYPVNFKFE